MGVRTELYVGGGWSHGLGSVPELPLDLCQPFIKFSFLKSQVTAHVPDAEQVQNLSNPRTGFSWRERRDAVGCQLLADGGGQCRAGPLVLERVDIDQNEFAVGGHAAFRYSARLMTPLDERV